MSLEENIELLQAEVFEIKNTVLDISNRLPAPKYLYIKDISTITGYSKRFLMDNPWALPNYGLSDLPGRKKGWLRETADQYYKVPLRTRELEWLNMSDKERKSLKGVA